LCKHKVEVFDVFVIWAMPLGRRNVHLNNPVYFCFIGFDKNLYKCSKMELFVQWIYDIESVRVLSSYALLILLLSAVYDLIG